MSRALAIAALVLTASAVGSCSREVDPIAPTVRNVVVILVDTLRPDHLGTYGYDRDTSPTIDALADRGVTFENAFVQAPWTTPSIASMLCGLYPTAMDLGFWSDPGKVGGSVDTLAEVLRDAGFRTHAVTAKGGTNAEFGFSQGFDSYDEDAGYIQLAAERVESFLGDLGEDERFFLFLHTLDVHNFNPLGEYRDRFVAPYEGDVIPADLPANEINRFLQGWKTRVETSEFGDAEWAYIRSLYDACIRMVDDQLARVIAKLKETGRYDDTLIIITSDHGEEFGEHGFSGHGYTMYDENIRVPFILSHPSLPKVQLAPLVRMLDLAPTVAALCGVEPSRQWQGVDLAPVIEGRDLSLPVYVECAHSHLKTLRTEDAKLIAGKARPGVRLFALNDDPAEKSNLAEDPASAKQLEAMKRALLKWVRSNAGLAAKFSGRGGDAGMSEDARREMEALGYTGAGRKTGGGPGEFDWEGLLGKP